MKAREVLAEFGWLIDEDTLGSVPLVELLTLREKWPLSYEKATTSRERVIGDIVDSGIGHSLLALGLASFTDDDGCTWRDFVDPQNVRDEAHRVLFAMLAAKCYELAESLDADDEWDERNAESDRAEALLATALDTNGQQLYALFDPPPDDEDAEYEWYRRLGYDTLEDWLNREPWWQREGYSSEAEADAELDEDDDEWAP